ncbi:anti-sigma factor domain-containing protein [Microlunatus flavus]|uniref:Anti-sigma-K factor RskA n=1 Tax=Microlunatus flavus TaxID=1036181 RepID=A0A1H9KU94_9ACTN|nr:anti-sigma factor [Microlunatus flavus]SER02744.1 Anti-sigma-K factor RskA [Microlunatus flavus]
MAHPAPDLLALIALGEDADQVSLDHVATCRACTDEVHTLQQVAAVGRTLGPADRLVAPHPRVWQRIASDVNDGRVIPLPGAVLLREQPVVPPAEPDPVPFGGLPDGPRDGAARPADAAAAPRSPRSRPRWFVPALAAAAALVVGLGGGFALKGALDPAPDVVGATQLNALPSWSGANGTATVEEADGQRTLVVTMEMPAGRTVDGRLDVWMSDSRASDMLLMGSLNGLSGRFAVPAGVDLAAHPIVDVSLEPQDDPDPAHSDVSVVRGRLKL